MAREWVWLVGLWLVVTGYNLWKPYQVDDAAHLAIAAWIIGHPWHPMRGVLNWVGVAAPIYKTNQPHLYFYILAAWARCFGFGEVAMHALQSVFAALCIALFYRISRILCAGRALWMTAMLALNPAFIVEQNLMVDVPLLSLWLGFFEALLCGADAPAQHWRFARAGLFAAAAVLMKYSSLVLLPLMLAALLAERRRAQMVWLGVPVAALAAWSLFNWWDYGGVHLATAFHAGAKTYHDVPLRRFGLLRRLVKSVIAWTIAVGALTPLGLIAVAERLAPRRAVWVYAGCGLALWLLAVLVALRVVPDWLGDRALWLGFVVSGGAVLPLLWPGWVQWRCYAVLWVVAASLFTICLAPFIAARHVLLILPAILLLAGVELPRRALVFGLAMSVVISAGLGLSDFQFAAFYRAEARSVAAELPPGARIWAAGHWGWQYYALQAGLTQLDIERSTVLPGDYVLVPREADHELPAGISLALVRTDVAPFTPFNPFCTGRPGRFYLSYVFRGPWSLSAGCAPHLDIFRVLVWPRRPSLS